MRELAADLSEDERELLFKLGEEDPFCGIFLDENRPGLYTCRLCGLPLFKAVANLKVVPAGPVLLRRSLRIIFEASTIPVMAWPEQRSFALVAARTKDMSSRTDCLPPVTVFASIRDRLNSHQMGNPPRQTQPRAPLKGNL
jgi:hypothetical protein